MSGYQDDAVRVEARGMVRVVTIDRPHRRNAVDARTAGLLYKAFLDFDESDAAVAVLTGSAGAFCAGADLHALDAGEDRPVVEIGPGPMGPTRMRLGKPVVAAIEGPAVAGGLELALWCDLRVAAADARLGVLNRRVGVPLVDGGTVRLPRLIGQSRALDLVLTGRSVDGVEAERIGLVNRVVPPGQALAAAVSLAEELAAVPQDCLRGDRRSLLDQWGLPEHEAMMVEVRYGQQSLASPQLRQGVARFATGWGRHGQS